MSHVSCFKGIDSDLKRLGVEWATLKLDPFSVFCVYSPHPSCSTHLQYLFSDRLASGPACAFVQFSNQRNMLPSAQVNGIRRRIHGWSWQAFPIVMGTSAVFMTLSDLKHHPMFVLRIEMAFLVVSITLFLVNIVMLLLQAIFFPQRAWSRLQHPIHGISVPLMVVSFATIIVGTINYDVAYGHVSLNCIYALFWVYLAIAMATCFPMIQITFSQHRNLLEFAPSCAFPVFPLMLTGLVSANTLRVIDASDTRALGVLLVGYVVHGEAPPTSGGAHHINT